MDPLPLVVCGAATALYALGRRGRARVWREVSFYTGVALTFVVLEPPFDNCSKRFTAPTRSPMVTAASGTVVSVSPARIVRNAPPPEEVIARMAGRAPEVLPS